MKNNRDEDAAENLLKYANSFSIDKDKFAEAITNSHRTLQQTVMSVFMATIAKWAQEPFSDPRNKATIDLCKKIIDKNPDYSLPCI